MMWQLVQFEDLSEDVREFCESEFDLAKSLFNWDGQDWPMLSLGVYRYDNIGGRPKSIVLACSFKETPDDWWTETGMPVELIDHGVGLLRKAAYEVMLGNSVQTTSEQRGTTGQTPDQEDEQ